MKENLFVKTKIDACDWKDAITKAAMPLLESGGIIESYIDKMIENVIEYGPYIVIAPGIALAHARAEDGVNNQCFCISTLKKPVLFGNEYNDPVSLLVVMASANNNDHIEILKRLMAIISDEEKYNFIINSNSDEAVLSFVKTYLQM